MLITMEKSLVKWAPGFGECSGVNRWTYFHGLSVYMLYIRKWSTVLHHLARADQGSVKGIAYFYVGNGKGVAYFLKTRQANSNSL